VVRRATQAVLATSPIQTFVVVGCEAERVFEEVKDLPVRRVDCVEWAEGMSASLRLGVSQAEQINCDAVLIALCDQVALSGAHLQRLVAEWRATPNCAVASAYADAIGVPAIFPAAWFHELKMLQGDQGARSLLIERSSQVRGIVAEELTRDIDVPGDLSQL